MYDNNYHYYGAMRHNTEMMLQDLLFLLGSKKGYYASGSLLAKEVGTSRSAVWKAITSLRRYGYDIESRHGMGYRLVGHTDLPLPWELTKSLQTLFIGKQNIVYYRHTINSTQRIAISLAEKNPDSHGIVIIAEQQKSGRGRQNRKWLSPKGGIWLSVVLKPHIPAAKMTLLPFAAALAVRDSIKKCTQLDAKLRWPNDVTLSGKKVAGILIDISTEAEQVNYAVIGVGINANLDSSMISSHLENNIVVTSISDELGHNTSLLMLTRELLESLEYYYLELDASGHSTILERWRKNSDILGRKVAVVRNKKTIQGRAADINEDGSLLLRTDHEDIKVVADDILVRY
jgi:BirA family transcriptional regulator, biotin operon repressor / biotin---[acetyl-CoA-carboxylase] ligase